jgi:hypothetical protein
VDFGVDQCASAAPISCDDLALASNAGQRQNQRNRDSREPEGQLATSLGRYSPVARMRFPCFLPSSPLPLRATHSSISPGGSALLETRRAGRHIVPGVSNPLSLGNVQIVAESKSRRAANTICRPRWAHGMGKPQRTDGGSIFRWRQGTLSDSGRG